MQTNDSFEKQKALFEAGRLDEQQSFELLQSFIRYIKPIFEKGYSIVKDIKWGELQSPENRRLEEKAAPFFKKVASYSDFCFALTQKLCEGTSSAAKYFLCADAFDLVGLSIHNMSVGGEQISEPILKQCREQLIFYAELSQIFGVEFRLPDSINYFDTIGVKIEAFAFCIARGGAALENYFAVAPRKHVYWYNWYRYFCKEQKQPVCLALNDVARYICQHFDEPRVKRLVYYNCCYEVAAMEYAYTHGMPDVAKQIVENGYDNYLEIETLYMLYTYDSQQFYSRLKELKTVCLKRNLKFLKKGRYYIPNIFAVYPDEFITLLRELIQNELATIDPLDATNPRNTEKRSAPPEFV